jgi:hypothetical protein
MHEPNILKNPAMENRSQLDLHLSGNPSGGKRWTLSVSGSSAGGGTKGCARNGTTSPCSSAVNFQEPAGELKRVRVPFQNIFSLFGPDFLTEKR